MREAPWWGDPEEGEVARNPRLAAYVAAARRGARVRVLLDRHFDDPDHWNANAVAVRWLHEVASVEGLDLEARLGNPTGAGLHAKVVLVDLAKSAGDAGGVERGDGADRASHAAEGARASAAEPSSWYRDAPGGAGRWLHVGSLNGSEAASKANREVALQVRSAALHDRLAAVFEVDWAASPLGRVWLPVVGGGVQ
jgi:phosphatidylserine/phosphatidylglycerophosphate/cardiolipin synthase-like enzyme